MHAHTPILNNPERKKKKKKNRSGFSFTLKPVLSLHLFLCRLSVLIRPSVISANISCFLFSLNHFPASSSVLPPSPHLPWRKKKSGSFIYICHSHLACISISNTTTPKPSTSPLQFHINTFSLLSLLSLYFLLLYLLFCLGSPLPLSSLITHSCVLLL